ncbi:MAG: methylated-DNA--[protein]-cysteine S-methyltransferase [Verrucomicrobiae bacterium]
MIPGHRLRVTIEEASGIRSAGVGTHLEWGLSESPFGPCHIAWSARGVCQLAFPDPVSDASDAVHAALPRNDRGAEEMIRKIFLRKTAGRITVLVAGTAFQVKVWRALLLIPTGSVAAYSRIASDAGHPGAARAVGSACRANPVAWLIPCHRAVRAAGGVGGYRWGTQRKAAMLAAESAPGRIPSKKTAKCSCQGRLY